MNKIKTLITSLVLLWLGAVSYASDKENMDKTYREALVEAKKASAVSKSDVSKINFNEKFEDPNTKQSYYTDNPQETAYHGQIEQEDAGIAKLEEIGLGNIEKSEATKVVWGNLGKAKIKIDPKESWLERAKNIIKEANIKDKNSSPPNKAGDKANLKCKETKECKTQYEKKTCIQTTRDLRRACEKIPKVAVNDAAIYPGCQHRISPTGKEECLIGTYAPGGPGHGGCYGCPQTCNTHHVNLPKHLHARVEVAGSSHGYFYITVVNETTGSTLHSHSPMNNGQAFELTHSHTQNQAFKFVVCRANECTCDSPGYLTLYIDYKYKTANLESWEEINCHEV